MAKAEEVELELLGLQEAVAMLAAVAELDDVSPVCLEVAQLCGRQVISYCMGDTTNQHCYFRLPLCINIVGKLIRTFGSSNWEQDVPEM